MRFARFKWLPHVQAGKLRVVAVANETRSAVYPNAPTFIEVGFPKIVGYGWFGFMAPNGTPAAIVDRMSVEVNKHQKDPAVQKRMTDLGLEAQGGSPAGPSSVPTSCARHARDEVTCTAK